MPLLESWIEDIQTMFVKEPRIGDSRLMIVSIESRFVIQNASFNIKLNELVEFDVEVAADDQEIAIGPVFFLAEESQACLKNDMSSFWRQFLR